MKSLASKHSFRIKDLRCLSTRSLLTEATRAPPRRKHSTAQLDLIHNAAAPSFLVSNVERPKWKDLKTLFTASAIPMVGFGFMDNLVMIQAGSYIDSTLGVQLGLATMTAAAAGQVVSDVSGVVFGGSLERLLMRLSLIQPPSLTTAQRQLPICRNVSMAGAVLGVVIGCALGATTLLFVDLESRDRQHRATQLREIVTDMGIASLQSDAATIYLTDSATDKFDLDLPQSDGSTGKGAAPASTTFREGVNFRTQILHLKEAKSHSKAHECASTRKVILDQATHILYVPVNHNGSIMAVAEFHRSSQPFGENDQLSADVMSKHLAIFMERLVE